MVPEFMNDFRIIVYLSWLGLYGHPTPKASWLLGTPSKPLVIDA